MGYGAESASTRRFGRQSALGRSAAYQAGRPDLCDRTVAPDDIYVPYYDPLVVYGNWRWPGFAPMRWSPWSGHHARPGYSRSYYRGNGIRVGSGFFFGGVDWRQRHVNVINYNSFYYRNVHRHPNPGHRRQHNPDHRHGAAYSSPALHEQFNRAPRNTNTRGEFRGRYPTAPNMVPTVRGMIGVVKEVAVTEVIAEIAEIAAAIDGRFRQVRTQSCPP